MGRIGPMGLMRPIGPLHIGEKTNLAQQEPDRVAELAKAHEDVIARDNDAVAR